MIFEGTWTENVYTTEGTYPDIMAAYADGKVPVLHIPAYEYGDTGTTVTDELYVTISDLTKTIGSDGEHSSTLWAMGPATVTIAGNPYAFDIDESLHVTITIT